MKSKIGHTFTETIQPRGGQVTGGGSFQANGIQFRTVARPWERTHLACWPQGRGTFGARDGWPRAGPAGSVRSQA
jgi:hypothetical protein